LGTHHSNFQTGMYRHHGTSWYCHPISLLACVFQSKNKTHHRNVGLHLIFSFEGLVIASVIYSLPFMVHPIQSGLSGLSPSLRDASYVLGKSKTTTLFRVLLPNIKSSLLTGIVLAFAHTIGEFGVVLMIGGNLPGSTKVAAIAIYDEVESMNYHAANAYSMVLFFITFSILLWVYLINGGFLKRFWK